MGARGRWIHRASVRREAAADDRGNQCGRTRYPGVPAASVRSSVAQRRGAARLRLHEGHAGAAGGQIVRDNAGEPTGLLLAKPNASILYATLAKGPKLPFDYQLNSTRHFMRELNRLGVTGAIDAGGGFQNYPEDYAVIEKLHDAEGQLTIRIAYNLFTQKPKGEKQDFPQLDQDLEIQTG
jgi:predicted amidohydrolase YtcJ